MRDYLVKAFLIFGGMIFPLFLLELVVRLLPVTVLPPQLDTGVRRYFREHKELRYTIKRDTDVELKHSEFSFRLKTNLNFPDAGFRGGTLGRPAWGVALGDSFTFGAGVNQEATWVARLADLAKRDVINLGVPGYGPIQYTRAFEKYGLPLTPKIVFYALYTNDLEDCVRYEQLLRGHKRKMSVKRYLRENSVVYNLFSKLTGLKKRRSRYIEVPNVGMMLIPRKLNDPYDLGKDKYSSGWTLAARQIEKAYEYSKRIDAKFVLLYFPSKEEVYWDGVKATAAKRFASFEEWRDKLRNNVAEFCASRQLFCLDLSTELRARGSNGEKLYFPIDTHWNEIGHRVVAEEIYKFLSKAKIL
jgi:GDSL-like lipase/acylhydrolase family protein